MLSVSLQSYNKIIVNKELPNKLKLHENLLNISNKNDIFELDTSFSSYNPNLPGTSPDFFIDNLKKRLNNYCKSSDLIAVEKYINK